MKKLILLLLFCITLLPANNNIKYGKMVLLYVEMDYCQWCKKMDREVFDDNTRFQQLKKVFHIARITKESGNMPSFIKPKYYPTTYILSSDGESIVEEIEGYMKPKRYIQYLKTLDEIERSPDY